MSELSTERPSAPGASVPGAPPVETGPPDQSAAGTVAAGIFTSRLFGFVRERAVAHFFGIGAHADVFQVAFRGPNLLQNLLGEGTISAAFIPIYSKMIEEGREREAGRFAGAIFGLLLAVAAGLSLLGVALAEPIVTVFAAGFLEDASRVAAGTIPINRFDLAVSAVRIIFPMTGLLVLAAWCLGVLNSHRKFFLPYFAPVLWNVAIIAALLAAAGILLDSAWGITSLGGVTTDVRTDLLFAAFYGALFGGLLQFTVQLPLVFKVLRGFKLSISTRVKGVREALEAFGPVVAGRGVYQLSAWLDIFLGSFLAAGAVSSLRYAHMLYLLPVSLFGLSVAASELPELSRFSSDKMGAFMRRLDGSLSQMLFMTIPTLVGYLAFGFLIVGAIFRTGEFGLNESWLVYLVLGAYSIGLLATTMSRLLQNAFYALHNTKTPAKIAALRVAVSAVLAVPLMLFLDVIPVWRVVGISPGDNTLFLGSVGLALGATGGAWIELWRLKKSLTMLVPVFHLPWSRLRRMTATAVFAVVPSVVVWWLLPAWHVAAQALVVLAVYVFIYIGASYLQDAPEMERWLGRFLQRPE